MSRHDVIVVGAGPAGALTAREAARHGADVLLVDRSIFPRPKVCGCCLSARALDILGQVGLGDLAAKAGAVPLTHVALGARGCRADFALPGGVSLSRERFDHALVEAAVAAGVTFRPATIARLGDFGVQGRDVSLTDGTGESVVRAGIVVAADGLGGRLLGGRADEGSRVGAGAVTDDAPAHYTSGVIWMATGRAGYVGLVRLEDGRLDVAAALDRKAVRCAGPDGVATELLDDVGWPRVPGLNWRGTPPLTRRPAQLTAGRLIAVGDAAGYIEPFTGEGMAWALASAAVAGPLVARGWTDRTSDAWKACHRALVGRRQTTCRLAARVLRHPTLARAVVRLVRAWPAIAAPVLRRLNGTGGRS